MVHFYLCMFSIEYNFASLGLLKGFLSWSQSEGLLYCQKMCIDFSGTFLCWEIYSRSLNDRKIWYICSAEGVLFHLNCSEEAPFQEPYSYGACKPNAEPCRSRIRISNDAALPPFITGVESASHSLGNLLNLRLTMSFSSQEDHDTQMLAFFEVYSEWWVKCTNKPFLNE